MKYHVLRFIATKGFVSDAIKFVEGISFIDHMECKSRAGDKWLGAHAGIGVQEMPLDWAKHVVWERQYSIPVTDEQYELIMGFLESKIGTKYDYKDIFGILFHNRNCDDPDRLMCSALQYAALWKAGIMPLNVLPDFAHLVTPETLHLSPILIGHCTYKL
jgi:hypothetical protein